MEAKVRLTIDVSVETAERFEAYRGGMSRAAAFTQLIGWLGDGQTDVQTSPLADEIKAALPTNPDVLNAAGAVVQEARHHRGGTKGGALPSTVQKKIDTLEQVTTVGGTYCPRHTPKSCEPDCPHRVNVG